MPRERRGGEGGAGGGGGCVGGGEGASLSRSATTVDKQTGEQTGGHTHTRTHTHATCKHTEVHSRVHVTLQMDLNSRQRHGCICLRCRPVPGCAAGLPAMWVRREIFPPGFKQLKLINELSSSWTALCRLCSYSRPSKTPSSACHLISSLITVRALLGTTGQ